MKKIFVLFFIFLLFLVIGCKKSDSETAAGETVKTDSQEKKAVTALENYFQCIGNDDLKNIDKYATTDGIEIAEFINGLASKKDKDALKNYKADIVKSEFENDCYFITVKYVGLTDCYELVKDSNNWKVNNIVTKN